MSKSFLKISAAVAYGLLAGAGLNLFLTPAGIYSSGVNGAAQLLAAVSTQLFGTSVTVAVWILLLNLPLLVLSWLKLGRSFTFYTLLAVIGSSFFLQLFPQQSITSNLLLAAVFGGLLTGAGVGLCLRAGFCTGGTDIIVLVLQKSTGQTVGQIGLVVNGLIVAASGFLFGWEMALYSLVSIYVSTVMLDRFYLQQYKVTAMIVTAKGEEMTAALLAGNIRGLTVLPQALGGYSQQQRCVIWTVISQYELFFVRHIIQRTDPQAFVNIQPTSEVLGRFAEVKIN
ncbi:MAG: YitT family protein [Phascolarctobacterium sp.]|uniref:YitT family protein n=1 Tax=Phascolarctobacterium sp. TaxID=2049039 RepID=UPI0025CD1182|nr:YitT family protein [Phascolarctobacterium sp.]MCC8159512.1 YitT family protein [Phascolarctobacterium sp.]